MSVKKSVLIVEDDLLLQAALWEMLEEFGYLVCGATDTADKAVELAGRHDPMVVLMDIQLRGNRDGIEAAREIHEQTGTPVVFLTCSSDAKTLTRLYQNHPAAVLFKPTSVHQIQSALSDVEKNLNAA